jgi:hypothetical protein
MFSKRQLPDDLDKVAPAKRLRENIADLYLSNEISAARAKSLYSDGILAEAQNLGGFKKITKSSEKNIHRDLLRKLMKGSKWPSVYVAKVRAFDPKTQKKTRMRLPFFLPHEILATIADHQCDTSKLYVTTSMSSSAEKHIASSCLELQLDKAVGVGLWCDGVPCNWDRTESLEIVTINLPGLEGSDSLLRIPITAMNKKFMVKFETYDDILEIVAWSFQQLLLGTHSSQRHDNTAFNKTDSKRAKMKGKPLNVTGVLCEVRGDWKMFKDIFRFPGWNELAGCCWRCRACPRHIRDAGSMSWWRKERMSHWDLLAVLAAKDSGLSPLFGVPGIRADIFSMDWLHTADLGVTQDFLGNLFKLVLPKLPGRSIRARCSSLFVEIQEFYKRNDTQSRLDNLTPTMICGDKKPPKLRSKAAEARSLVPFAVELSEKYLRDTNMTEKAAKEASKALGLCYECLSCEKFSHEVLALNSKTFCLLYTALEENAKGKDWRVKPKMHLFQEICEESESRPSTCWTYRDEDFGGTIAKISRRRGGKNTVYSTAFNVLNKFVAKNKVPILS